MAFTTINKSSDYFSSTLYTGNSTARTITTGHQSDFIWIKQRNTTRPHCLFDTVNTNNFAGGNSQYLVGNTNSALSSAQSDQVTATTSTGFTMGTDASSDQINHSGSTAVAWSWKANGAGSSNTDGSITSTVSVDTTGGFSIVKYTGAGSVATIGHGLGVAPKMIIFKRTNVASDWIVYHEGTGNNSFCYLNTTTSQSADSNILNNTSPTSSVFTIGTTNGLNQGPAIAYCFAEKQGFSKISTYVGNGQGNANGTFVYTGFKPSFVFIRNVDFDSNWNNFTGDIPSYNQINDTLQPNRDAAENGTFAFDMLSNGFKHRSGDVMDRNGNTHIYMAIAEAPLVGTNNVPANAR